ncbi:general stress protein [Bacillus sp. ISL-35]|uniref:general stress protein n=1 Tax=Bacillus sp. ISL-35 TaxID=2819122 RepID=UPI001BEAB7DE|nr:general stress protein [Bacillus sp. ISL-35]MBT2679787.1 general stress protein [Bacillus sp. ISL-35]MBT2704821.1 general stress protein [Chryseobacterium sp. ISL-80]
MFEHEKHLVGVYDNEQDAIQAVEDLKRQGYNTDDISVISKNDEEVDHVNEATGTKTEEGLAAGAATGGILGGLTGLLAGIGALAIPGIGPIVAAGPIAATLTGAAVGAGAGGLAGALIGMGIPEDEAERYEGYVKEGKILVVVERDENRVGLNDGTTTTTAGLDGTRTNNPVDAPLTSDNPANTRFDNTRDF